MNRSWYRRKILLLGFFLFWKATKAWQSFAAVHRIPKARTRILCLSSKRYPEECERSVSKTISKLTLDNNAVPELQKRLQQAQEGVVETEGHELVQVEGYLTSLRQFGPSFCFLDLSKRGLTVPVQAMMKRQDFGDASSRFDGFMKSLVPGIRIAITGPVGPTRNPGEALVLIRDIRIQKLPHNPQHVRKLLRLVSEGLLEAKDLVLATNKTEEELVEAIQQAKTTMKPGHPKMFNGLAKAILAGLQEDHDNDLEYPDLSNDHKLRHSLPEAPVEIQIAPVSSFPTMPTFDALHADENENVAEPLSIQGVLLNYAQNSGGSDIEKVTIVTGWVQNRRRFRGSITALEVVDEMVPVGTSGDPSDSGRDATSESTTINPDPTAANSFSSPRLKCVIHPEVFQCSNATLPELYGHLLAPGWRIRMTGYIARSIIQGDSDAVGETLPTFWVRKITLQSSSWRLSVVQFLLDGVVAGNFGLEEAAKSLKLSNQEMSRIVAINDLTKRQWEGIEIAQRLQQQAMDGLHVDHDSLKMLESFEGLRNCYPLTFVDAAESYISRTDFVSTQGSRWKRKKEPQLEWMAEQVKSVLKECYPYRFRGTSSRHEIPLRILDVGGGKGFLANHLARSLLDSGYQVEILVLDVAEGAVRNGRSRSERRNLSHVVQYAVADASTVDSSVYGDVDLVVALHACGTLTDVALGHAVNQQAAFVICPCCFLSNPQLIVPTIIRRGDEVKKDGIAVREWLDIDSGPYEKIKGLAEKQGDLKLANRAIHTLCALRLTAVQTHASIPMDVSIRTFPVAFSTRNFCLVGTTQK